MDPLHEIRLEDLSGFPLRITGEITEGGVGGGEGGRTSRCSTTTSSGSVPSINNRAARERLFFTREAMSCDKVRSLR
jgi:hypothetical protein